MVGGVRTTTVTGGGDTNCENDDIGTNAVTNNIELLVWKDNNEDTAITATSTIVYTATNRHILEFPVVEIERNLPDRIGWWRC